MHILIVGLNHKTAPLEIREKLSFSSSTLCGLLNRIHPPQAENGSSSAHTHTLHEGVILSTCNRLEFYAIIKSPKQAEADIINLLAQTSQIEAETLKPYLYIFQDQPAIEHLLRVASGLDSMVLGEAQILGQVVEAHQTAVTHGTTGPILTRLFQIAIHAGKRARTETDINLNAVSISSMAVRLAKELLGDLENQVVMILGAGEMGKLTIETLINWGFKELFIVNRNKQRAESLAQKWGATALTFDQLEIGLEKADLIITSTAAPHTVIHQYQVAQVMKTRERPMLIIDIALPRDVETSVGEVDGVHLYNLDELETQLAYNIDARRQEIPKVEKIIVEEFESFIAWYHSLHVVPTITSLRQQFESIRQQELERTLNRMQNLDEREKELVADLSRRIMNKFLHQPTVRLRSEAVNGNGIAYTTALRDLFALKVDPS